AVFSFLHLPSSQVKRYLTRALQVVIRSHGGVIISMLGKENVGGRAGGPARGRRPPIRTPGTRAEMRSPPRARDRPQTARPPSRGIQPPIALRCREGALRRHNPPGRGCFGYRGHYPLFTGRAAHSAP